MTNGQLKISGKKRRLKIAAAALVLLVLAAGTIYAKRQDLRDLYWRRSQGPVPPALTLEQINKNRAAANMPAEPKKPATPAAEPETPDTVEPKPPAVVSAVPEATEPSISEPTPATDEPALPPPPDQDDLPAEINLLVPMIYQAPLSNWDATHDEACEEAAILMIQAYLNGEKTLSREEMDRRILAVVDYQMKTLGYFEDTDAETTAAIMRDHLKLTGVRILPVSSIDDIKTQIAAGRPVVLPADGKALRNPNFRNGGPVYHMLVAKGFKPGKIITNEPGTRLGADYIYDEEVLFGAIHDWNGGDTPNGAKVMIVVEQ